MKKNVLLVLLLLLVTTLQVVPSREDEKAVAPRGWSVLVGPPFPGTNLYAVVASDSHTNSELLAALAGVQVGQLYVGFIYRSEFGNLKDSDGVKKALKPRSLDNNAPALQMPFLPLSSLIARPDTQTHED